MLRRVLAGVGLVAALVLAGPVPAQAGAGCTRSDPRTGSCSVGGSAGGGGQGSGGGQGGGGSRGCWYGGAQVPCSSADGPWNGAHQCYMAASEGPVGALAPAGWKWYRCIPPGASASSMVPLLLLPPGAESPPDPAQVAQQLVAELGFRAPGLGMAPEDRPGSMGAVGAPVWMWVPDPGPATTGPASKSTTVAGYTVSLTATWNGVEYAMGDGTTVRCGLGSRYDPRLGVAPSPTCGHRYERQGTYTVTATSRWTVRWTGIGQSGTIPLSFTRTRQLDVGEVQVVIR